MKRSELVSRILITVAVIGAVGAPLFFWSQSSLMHARVAESGGWNPNIIRADVGAPLHLRLTSDDVVHGFAVGQMNMDGVDVLPGKVTDLTLTFDKPGTYTFYCTRWCGLNHWRMRGTIEVGGSNTDAEPAPAPLYVSLGLDIDAPHEAPAIPSQMPSAFRGESLIRGLAISQFINSDFYRVHSPYETFENLDQYPLGESQRWDVVAYIWQSNTTLESLANGKKLYAQNCAACHGENGAGNGVFADDLLPSPNSGGGGDEVRSMIQTPANFTDPKRILGASPALLQGKILRGGMGTGMPMWGSIFTEGQIWDLIAFIYSFQFEYQN